MYNGDKPMIALDLRASRNDEYLALGGTLEMQAGAYTGTQLDRVEGDTAYLTLNIARRSQLEGGGGTTEITELFNVPKTVKRVVIDMQTDMGTIRTTVPMVSAR